MTVLQSMLFVPGTKPERFAKALASGADSVCIDLEDAVPPEDKAAARAAAIKAVTLDTRIAIRINALTTRHGIADLLALAEAEQKPSLIYLPMVETAGEVAVARSVLGDPAVGLIPLIETVEGLGNVARIAADPGVAMVMLGGADLAVQLGVTLSWEPLLLARSQLLLACAGAGKGAIDVPWIQYDDIAGLEAETRKAKALGFAAKGAIHPAQIEPIHRVMRPSAEEIAEAREAEEVFAAAGGGAVRFRGKMLDAPIIKRYRQVLAIGGKQNA
jgi:citrate lyase beta subunit